MKCGLAVGRCFFDLLVLQVCSSGLMLCYWVGRSKRLSWKGSCGDIHLVKWCESARPEGDRQVSLHLPKPVDRHPFVQADDREGGQKRHRHSRWEHSHLQREREAGGQSTCHFGSGTGQELPGPRGKSVLCNEEGSTRGKTKLFHTNLNILKLTSPLGYAQSFQQKLLNKIISIWTWKTLESNVRIVIFSS